MKIYYNTYVKILLKERGNLAIMRIWIMVNFIWLLHIYGQIHTYLYVLMTNFQVQLHEFLSVLCIIVHYISCENWFTEALLKYAFPMLNVSKNTTVYDFKGFFLWFCGNRKNLIISKQCCINFLFNDILFGQSRLHKIRRCA